MKKNAFLAHLLFTAPFLGAFAAGSLAQEVPTTALHVVKSSINSETDNAELCLEFDKPLAPITPLHLQTALRLEADGKAVTPQNIDTTASSLCLFPLERGKAYNLFVNGLKGTHDEHMSAAYHLPFTIPDRTPSLAFTNKNGGVTGFGSYDDALALRAVNVANAKVSVYRITDPVSMTRAWQDRGQTSLAPSESAYLARTKGQVVWEDEATFEAPTNTTVEQKFVLHDKLPALSPGLYLIVADANSNVSDAAKNSTEKPASKGLAPLVAAWFTKSDFRLHALRDDKGIHVFTRATDKLGIKTNIHLFAMSKKPDPLTDILEEPGGVGTLAYPPAPSSPNDIATIIGIDPVGNVAFTDISNLPALSHLPALGSIASADPFVVPGDTTDLSLALTSPENTPKKADASFVHLMRPDAAYPDIPVPALTGQNASLSFVAPAQTGAWSVAWHAADGTPLAEAPLRVATNADMPRLSISSSRDALTPDAPWPVTIKSLTSSDRPEPLVGGKVMIAWQRQDPATAGWSDYQFGTPTAILNAAVQVADFLTDLEGTTQLKLTLPPRPQDPGLYQAVLTTVPEADSSVAMATPVILPLHPDGIAIGVKPLSEHARFAQNGIARFALIGLSSDGDPQDVTNISYQIYEEGRSFAWYQDEGRWKYKPEPQLRPIGGGPLVIKADGSSILELPVAAGNYRLEIRDAGGKSLTQTTFSAGWDTATTFASNFRPLNVTLPKILQPDHEVQAHFQLIQPAMVTAIVGDTHVRKIVHEMRDKGDNSISFTPGTDWQSGFSVTIDAIPQNENLSAHGMIEGVVAQSKVDVATAATGVALVATDNPSALILHSGEQGTLAFGLENRSEHPETYHYTFSTTPGLKIESGESGVVTLGPRQSRALPLSLSGDQIGLKDLRMEVDSPSTGHSQRLWNVSVLGKTNFLNSVQTFDTTANQPILSPDVLKGHNGTTVNDPIAALISRRPMDGLVEILAFAFNVHPFTTQELALGIDALRLWAVPLTQIGFASDALIAARQQEWLTQLLRRQNVDGGFANMRGNESTMDDTSAALLALGPNTSPLAAPARSLAIDWLKQRLANTWFEEKERASRAGAYAALAAADALDATNLHYFSDVSANSELPPIAKANIAAAFKHIHDPNAAAFWIKRMLDGPTEPKSIAVLNALAATDALSSDDVHTAMRDMVATLHKGTAPSLTDVGGLLRSIAADTKDAAPWNLSVGNQTKEISGVFVLRTTDPNASTFHTPETQPLSVTLVGNTERSPSDQPSGATVARHIFRLNGVELSPQGKPARGEIYMVELKGTGPELATDEQILVHDGSASTLRPINCPLSPKVDAPSFIPWFTPRELSAVRECEVMPHELNVVLAPTESGASAFDLVYFAHLDALSIGDMNPPRLRVIK